MWTNTKAKMNEEWHMYSSSVLTENINIYTTVILAVILYGCEA